MHERDLHTLIDPIKEKNGYVTGVYNPDAFNGTVWKIDFCQKKRCPLPPKCSNKCSFGFLTDNFGCQTTCNCGETIQLGDTTIMNDRVVQKTESGQSNFVPRYFKAWDNIKRDGKYLIPYEIQPEWATQKADDKTLKGITARDLLMQAFNRLESNSSIEFVERTNEEQYLFFKGFEDFVCRSYIGQQDKKSGAQAVTLGKGCLYYHTILHEVSVTSMKNN